jgi:hypothetical protein
MPVDGRYRDVWWLHVDRGEVGNHVLRCPFGVVPGAPTPLPSFRYRQQVSS